ncbi:hypothetical protein HDV00_011421 [Rhizophlyctis rosea]|nr:hypothetical protein HDV00_011421 [Rhizophlyctis rosea]
MAPVTPVLEHQLQTILTSREKRGLLRTLRPSPSSKIDFSSNDYLGLSHNPALHAQFLSALSNHTTNQNTDRLPPLLGSTGSRLLSGDSTLAHSLESFLSTYHSSPSALLFNSGYDANLALFSTLPQPIDLVLIDALVHASVHDGIRTCRARKVATFKHNDVADLEMKIGEWFASEDGKEPGANVVVAVEGCYSMDGDLAPLNEIVEVLEKFEGRAVLVVDEAHSTGVYGPQGRGLAVALGLEDRIYARLVTFGKALGCHGAVVLGSPTLRSYLINYARPLVYSTFISNHGVIAIRTAYSVLEREAEQLQKTLHTLIHTFRTTLLNPPLPTPARLLPSTSPIQGILLPSNPLVNALATLLQQRGYDVRSIRSPTVPKGTERVRVCLHVHNSVEEVKEFARVVRWAVGVVVGGRGDGEEDGRGVGNSGVRRIEGGDGLTPKL